MNLKIGDKVRFLNSTGGGVIRRFQGKDRVLIEDGDGFEIPVLIKECVVVNENTMQVHSKLQPKVEIPTEVPQPSFEPEIIPIIETPEGERLNIFLAYLPIDSKSMQQSGYEAYFINDSNYFLFYNYANRQNNSWFSRANGLIEPNTRIFLEEFQKEDLNDLERLCVQFIAFKKDNPYALKNAVSVELRIDTVKFYKTHCFVPNDFFDEDALIYPVVQNDTPECELLVSAAEIQQAMLQKVREDKRKPQPIAMQKKKEAQIPEIDLHINQLLDSTAGMTPADILNYQLGKLHEVLASYVNKKGQKIIFIHGKGDGVLRKAIEKELKTRYKNYYYQDASFREYGFGATLVTIK